APRPILRAVVVLRVGNADVVVEVLELSVAAARCSSITAAAVCLGRARAATIPVKSGRRCGPPEDHACQNYQLLPPHILPQLFLWEGRPPQYEAASQGSSDLIRPAGRSSYARGTSNRAEPGHLALVWPPFGHNQCRPHARSDLPCQA